MRLDLGKGSGAINDKSNEAGSNIFWPTGRRGNEPHPKNGLIYVSIGQKTAIADILYHLSMCKVWHWWSSGYASGLAIGRFVGSNPAWGPTLCSSEKALFYMDFPHFTQVGMGTQLTTVKDLVSRPI